MFKLIDVVSIQDITRTPMVARELALIKVPATNCNRREVLDLVEVLSAEVVDVHAEALIVQVLGDEGKVDVALKMFERHGILETVRAGRVAMRRGAETTTPPALSDSQQSWAATRAMFGRQPEDVAPWACD